MHERKEGEPGIQNRVRDIGPYTRVGMVVDCENYTLARTISSSLAHNHVSEKEGYLHSLSARAK